MNLFEALNGNVRRLRHINRYSSYPCIKPESVAEHSFQVAFISFLIGEDLSLAHNEDINFAVLLGKALMHDVSECMSGDIIRTYKYSSEEMRLQCEAADEQNMGILMEDFHNIGPSVYHEWKHAKSANIEGDIVRFADLVAVVIYCAEEWHLGIRQLDATLERCYRNSIHQYHNHPLFEKYADQMFPSRSLLAWREAYRLDTTYGNEHDVHLGVPARDLALRMKGMMDPHSEGPT